MFFQILFGIVVVALAMGSTIPDTGQNRFDDYSDLIHVDEDTAIGAVVYSYEQVFPQLRHVPEALLFTTVPAASTNFKYSKSGEIVLTERLDRELICAHAPAECALTLHILFKLSSGGQRLMTLTIVVSDVNDLPPEFQIPFSGMTLKLCAASLENSMSGDVFLARDFDKSKFKSLKPLVRVSF